MTPQGSISREVYLSHRRRRFGASNPERIENPVWQWMLREKLNPWTVRESLGLEHEYDLPKDERDWCFDRFGAPKVHMPDGRLITVAGEYEDAYDPDFCIYNDVVVQRGDKVEFYTYPRSLFPPTDFHTATLVGDAIYLIGSLGYQDERAPGPTPVYRLDANTYRIEPVSTTGISPGWIHRHRAQLVDDRVIRISGGDVVVGDANGFKKGIETFELDLATHAWNQTTSHDDWRQFSMCFRTNADSDHGGRWYMGGFIEELGYPCTRGAWARPAEDSDVEYPIHAIHTGGTDIRLILYSGRIAIIVEGPLPQSDIDELLARLTRAVEGTNRTDISVAEL